MRHRLRWAALAAVALAACGDGKPDVPPPPDPCALDTAGAPWLLFTSTQAGNYDLWLTRLDGTCRRQVTTDPAADLLGTWLGPGSLGFFSTRVAGIGIYRRDLAAGTDAGVPISGATAVTAPAWNADRSQVVFEGRRAGVTHSEIFAAPGDGGDAVVLTQHTGTSNDAGPIWSPDGTTIYFVSNRAGATQVYAMSADGNGQAAVTAGPSVLGRPALSPDGAKLAFARASGGARSVLYVRDLATGEELSLTPDGDSDSDPAWDATGAHLAVSRVHGGASPAVWIMDADGANASQVTTPPAGAVDGQPAFRPE